MSLFPSIVISNIVGRSTISINNLFPSLNNLMSSNDSAANNVLIIKGIRDTSSSSPTCKGSMLKKVPNSILCKPSTLISSTVKLLLDEDALVEEEPLAEDSFAKTMFGITENERIDIIIADKVRILSTGVLKTKALKNRFL